METDDEGVGILVVIGFLKIMEGTFHVSRIEWRRTKGWNRIKRWSVFFEVLHRSENRLKSGDRSIRKKRDSNRSNCQVTRASHLGCIARSYRISKAFPCRFIEQNWLRNMILLLVTVRPIIISHSLWIQFFSHLVVFVQITSCNLISLASRTNKNSIMR